MATCVRELMAERGSWAGCALDLLRVGADRNRTDVIMGGPEWPKNPRALAGRLRRAQTFLRAMGIEIAFRREGRAGSRVIRMHTTENTVSTVSSVRNDNRHPDLAGPCPIEPVSVSAADDADGADANTAFHFG